MTCWIRSWGHYKRCIRRVALTICLETTKVQYLVFRECWTTKSPLAARWSWAFNMDYRYNVDLVAPCCVILLDYLRDTPLLRTMGLLDQVLVTQHGQFGAIPPPPFLSLSPLKSMWSGGAIPRPPKGVSQRCLRDTIWKQGKVGAIPLCDSISKRYWAI